LQSQLATRSPAALAALLIASVLPGGCIGTPLPEPPNFSPQTGLGVDPMRAGCLDCDHFFLRIFGAPGTVSPDATLIVTRIDRDLPPSLHAPAADGSFDLTLMLSPYEELRLEAERDGLRSPPFDLLADPDSLTPLSPLRPLADCFLVSPLEVVSAPLGTTTLAIENRCASPLTIGRASFRSASSAWSTDAGAVPFVIEAGARRELVVTAPPSPSEDLLLFESSTPFDRRIVTVRAR
jgi:hypothetical protein